MAVFTDVRPGYCCFTGTRRLLRPSKHSQKGRIRGIEPSLSTPTQPNLQPCWCTSFKAPTIHARTPHTPLGSGSCADGLSGHRGTLSTTLVWDRTAGLARILGLPLDGTCDTTTTTTPRSVLLKHNSVDNPPRSSAQLAPAGGGGIGIVPDIFLHTFSSRMSFGRVSLRKIRVRFHVCMPLYIHLHFGRRRAK